MSDHSHALAAPEAEQFDPKKLGGLPNLLLIAGAAGCGISLLGFLLSPAQAAHPWS